MHPKGYPGKGENRMEGVTVVIFANNVLQTPIMIHSLKKTSIHINLGFPLDLPLRGMDAGSREQIGFYKTSFHICFHFTVASTT